MSDDKKQLDRMESMLTQLIDIVGKTNAMVSDLRDGQTRLEAGQEELKTELSEVKDTAVQIEHRLNVMERRQAKMVDRVDTLEAEVNILQKDKQ